MTLQELYSRDDSWTQDALVRDKNGVCLLSRINSEEAYSWCVLGGMFRCYENNYEYFTVREKLVNRIGNIVDWNNEPGRTIDEVRELVKELNV